MKVTLLNISSFDEQTQKYICDFEIYYEEDNKKIIKCKGSKSSSSSQSTSNTTTKTTTKSYSGALESIEGEAILNQGGTVTVNNPDAAYLNEQNQAFLNETFSTALNFVNDGATKALEIASGRDLDDNTSVDNEDENSTKLLIALGILTTGAVAYKVMK